MIRNEEVSETARHARLATRGKKTETRYGCGNAVVDSSTRLASKRTGARGVRRVEVSTTVEVWSTF